MGSILLLAEQLQHPACSYSRGSYSDQHQSWDVRLQEAEAAAIEAQDAGKRAKKQNRHRGTSGRTEDSSGEMTLTFIA